MKKAELELIRAAKQVIGNYEYDIDWCIEMRPPHGCRKCKAMRRLENAVTIFLEERTDAEH